MVIFCILGKFAIVAVSRIIGYICLAVYEVAKLINEVTGSKVIDGIAKVGTSLVCSIEHNRKCIRYESNRTESIVPQIDLDQFQILMQLSHGECKDFETAWKVFKYIFLLIAGGESICKNLTWFRTISLTRIFVFYPASSILWVDSQDNCETSIATNVCAFSGMALVLDFVLKDCILPIVVIVGCWPLIKNACRLITCEIRLAIYEVKYLLLKLHPSKRCPDRGSFCRRRRRQLMDAAAEVDGEDDRSGLRVR